MAYDTTIAALIANTPGAKTTWESEFNGYTPDQQAKSIAILQSLATSGISASQRNIVTEVYDISGADLQAGNLTAWTAPAACIVHRVILDITTASTGASTIDVGYTATSATTSSDSFLDGVSGASIAVLDSMNYALDSGANAKAQKAASGKWITVDSASGDTTGLVAKLYIQYFAA